MTPRLCSTWMCVGLAAMLGGAGLEPQARGQQLIGYVSTKDADVTGATDVMDGHAVLAGAVAVTAKDRPAPITLGRGGVVRVCQTSVLHMTESRSAELAAPLLLSLDHGAIEVQMSATPSDAVMTPDLRFAVREAGALDLRMRVSRNGDTCVENRGSQAPVLAVVDAFGDARYELRPGQHVLFEHGSLREVVDNESIPCGCPVAGVSIAEALLAPGAGAKLEEKHPFPEAQSAGLAPAPDVPPAPAVATQTTPLVSTALSYDAQAEEAAQTQSASVAAASASGGAQAAAATQAQDAESAKQKKDVVHVIGRFFRRLFGGN